MFLLSLLQRSWKNAQTAERSDAESATGVKINKRKVDQEERDRPKKNPNGWCGLFSLAVALRIQFRHVTTYFVPWRNKPGSINLRTIMWRRETSRHIKCRSPWWPLNRKVGFINFQGGGGEIKIFCSWKEKIVEHQSVMEVQRTQKDRFDSVSGLNSGEWVLLLTLWDLQIHPSRTDPLMFWPKRRSLRRPPVETRLQRRWRCRPPAARTRTLHSVPLGTTSSPRRDTWWWKFESCCFSLAVQ